jgi:hypothetical protein
MSVTNCVMFHCGDLSVHRALTRYTNFLLEFVVLCMTQYEVGISKFKSKFVSA